MILNRINNGTASSPKTVALSFRRCYIDDEGAGGLFLSISMILSSIRSLFLAHWPFPAPTTWLIWTPIGFTAALGGGYTAFLLKTKNHLKAGYSRKIFHFLIFTLAGLVGAIGGFPAVQAFGSGVGIVILAAVFRGGKSRLFQAVSRPTDTPYERAYVLVPFLMTVLGGITSNLFFGRLALIGYIAAGWGDALGEPIGTRWGRHTYRVPTLTGIRCVRSIEGSLAVFLGSMLGVMLVFRLAFGLSGGEMVAASAVVALSTTVVEAVSFHSLDNLTIQVFSTGTAFLALRALGLFI